MAKPSNEARGRYADLLARTIGACLIATAMLLRARVPGRPLYDAIVGRAPAGAPAAFDFLAFVLTCTGVLLFVHGTRSGQRTSAGAESGQAERQAGHDPESNRGEDAAPLDNRYAMAALLTERAIERARTANRSRAGAQMPPSPPSVEPPGRQG